MTVDNGQGARKTAGHARHSGTVAQQSAAACPGSSLHGTCKSTEQIMDRDLSTTNRAWFPLKLCHGRNHVKERHPLGTAPADFVGARY